MDPVVLILRVLHIGSGVFWVGSAFASFLFLLPSAKAVGPDAYSAFMDQVTRVRRFPYVILGAGITTVLADAGLYYRASGGFSGAWLASPTGIGFTIGAIAGILSLTLGPLFIVPSIGRTQAIEARLKTEQRPPTAAEEAALEAIDSRLTRVGRFDLVLLAVAVVMMATARYFG